MTRLLCAALLAACLTSPAFAGSDDAPSVPSLELTADATVQAPNDLASASAYVEVSGDDPAKLAQEANTVIDRAIEIAKAYPQVRTRSAGSQTQVASSVSPRA